MSLNGLAPHRVSFLTVSVLPGRNLRRWSVSVLVALALLYLALLIPDGQSPAPTGAGKETFVWGRDAFWLQLEDRFRAARELNATNRETQFQAALEQVHRALDAIAETNLQPQSPAFDVVESAFFQLATLAATCPERTPDFMLAARRLQQLTKWQSEHWPADSSESRRRLYRLLYGRRAAVEEVLLQSPQVTNTLELSATSDRDETPSALVRGVKFHSGDILVSRGGAATSALIARGNDFPGNFSHIALVHVDGATEQVSVIESHIESGVGDRKSVV